MFQEWTRVEVLMLLSIVGTVVTAGIGIVVGKRVADVHILVNSRLSQLLDATATGERAVGVQQGRDAQKAESQMVT